MSIDDPAKPDTDRPEPPGTASGSGTTAVASASTGTASTGGASPAADPATAGPAADNEAVTVSPATTAKAATPAPVPGPAPVGAPGGLRAGDAEDEPPAPAPQAGTATPPPVPAPSKGSLRPLVLRMHFYAGILVAPFLLIAAVTGLLYAASYPLEKVIYADELTVPVPEGKAALPLSQQVGAAVEAHPGGTLSKVWPSPEAGATTRVLFEDPGLGESKSTAVFVDPYTAEVRGELLSYGSSGALPVRAWISEFHRHLHLGEPGRLYSELAASWLWVVALGGLLLWLRRRRATRGARGLLLPERGLTGRRRTMSRHGAIGVWSLLGLLFLSATGLTWSTYAGENVALLREQVRGTTPAVTATVDPAAGTGADGHEGHGSAHGDGGHQPGEGGDIGLDRLMDTAREQGVSESVVITLPADEKGAYVVAENDKQWPVHFDSVSVHPATGEVVDTLAFADYPVLAQLTRFGIDAHMGLFLGLPNQLLLIALMAGLIVLIVYGYRMWWQRRPARGTRFGVGRPMPRGAWRKAPPGALAGLLAAAVLLGWFVPLFGLGLVLFLAVDLLRGAVARRRADVS
ncbi:MULTISPECIES: PepSY-associated TM helix domain-containing protein [Streptomyces]|nr:MULTISPECIES: PepSY domain-containing protein [Streptomyces]